MLFKNRTDAGQKLALKLLKYKNDPETIAVGLPRGGVVVAYEVARVLSIPLDVTCPRKIGAPFNPEYAIGAITETGEGILNTSVIEDLGISENYLTEVMEKERKTAEKRLHLFRKNRPPRDFSDKHIILIDDGIATGSTLKAAIETVKKEGATKITVAVPVAPTDSVNDISDLVDDVVILATPPHFAAVGQFYELFEETTDGDVVALMEKGF